MILIVCGLGEKKQRILTVMKTELLAKFGARIRVLRKAKKWSQEQLADKTGFHRTYIGMAERGERNVSLTNLYVFAQTFEVSLSELLMLD